MMDSSEICEQTMSSTLGSESETEPKIKTEDDSDQSKDVSHLEISNKRDDILLSCKGLAAEKKVNRYFKCEVIDGKKTFVCLWKGKGKPCQWMTRTRGRIALHINLSHIGLTFKCPKLFCQKEFKSPNSYRDHLKNHMCGFSNGSKNVIGTCRNDSINRYRQRVSINGNTYNRCVFRTEGDECGSITSYYAAIKRHIHSHICPHRKNLKLPQNRGIISQIKNEIWGLPSPAKEADHSISHSPSQVNSEGMNASPQHLSYQCRRLDCTEEFNNSADLLRHENFFCPFIKNGLRQALIKNKGGKFMPKISSQELANSPEFKVIEGKRKGRPTKASTDKKMIKRRQRQVKQIKAKRSQQKNETNEHNYPEFKSSSRVLNKILKNKQRQQSEQSIKTVTDSNLSVDSSDPMTSYQLSQDLNDSTPLQLVCDVSPTHVMSESSDESIDLDDFLEGKPILKHTIDTLKSFGFDSKNHIIALNLNTKTKTNDNDDQAFDETFDDISEEKYPYLKEIMQKEMKSLQQREDQLRKEVEELEQSIDLIQNLFRETVGSDVKEMIAIKNLIIDKFHRKSK